MGTCRRCRPGDDPITGFGIGHALRDAELLSAAITGGLGGTSDLNQALTGFEKQRDRETNPNFDWTLNLAQLRGVSEVEERLFAAIGADHAEVCNFSASSPAWYPCDRSSAQVTLFHWSA